MPDFFKQHIKVSLCCFLWNVWHYCRDWIFQSFDDPSAVEYCRGHCCAAWWTCDKLWVRIWTQFVHSHECVWKHHLENFQPNYNPYYQGKSVRWRSDSIFCSSFHWSWWIKPYWRNYKLYLSRHAAWYLQHYCHNCCFHCSDLLPSILITNLFYSY